MLVNFVDVAGNAAAVAVVGAMTADEAGAATGTGAGAGGSAVGADAGAEAGKFN